MKMKIKIGYILGGGALVLVICAAIPTVVLSKNSNMSTKPKSEEFIIKTTWNNQTVPQDEFVYVKITLEDEHLVVDVEGKFYNDPKLPDWTNDTRTHTTLYNYEVIELFLLAPNEHYLEIELGPKGQYFLLEFKGAKKEFRYPIEVDKYIVKHNDNRRWSGKAYISIKDLPQGIFKLNAFAIHGSNDKRVYMALYPAPFNSSSYPEPDFHKLELFQENDFFK